MGGCLSDVYIARGRINVAVQTNCCIPHALVSLAYAFTAHPSQRLFVYKPRSSVMYSVPVLAQRSHIPRGTEAQRKDAPASQCFTLLVIHHTAFHKWRKSHICRTQVVFDL